LKPGVLCPPRANKSTGKSSLCMAFMHSHSSLQILDQKLCIWPLVTLTANRPVRKRTAAWLPPWSVSYGRVQV
jgi:hypothetical protein